jgi:hypothetical protein
MGYGGPNPTVFLQTPKVVWIVFFGNQQIRRVYMDVPHSENPKPSWYGESVGHYEGDTLVIDTIGLNTRTFVDVYRTPHTEKLHVVEHWHMIDDGKMMEATFTVDDPDAFTFSRLTAEAGVHCEHISRTSVLRSEPRPDRPPFRIKTLDLWTYGDIWSPSRP